MKPVLLPFLAITLFAPALLGAQVQSGETPPVDGLRENTPQLHALTEVRVVTGTGEVLEGATVVIRDGLIQAVGPGVEAPAGARVREMSGYTIYPGFIDPHSSLGMDEPRLEERERGPSYWNPQVQSFVSAAAEYVHDDAKTEVLRRQGVGVALAVPQLGIFRGETALVSLGEGPNIRRILDGEPAHSVSFSRDLELGQTYPTSLMGSIALIRQTLYDAQWYGEARATWEGNPQGSTRPETNQALAALQAHARGDRPLLVETRNEDELGWALEIGDEFPVSLWIRGSGSEYRVPHLLERLDGPLILPVAFPEAPDVETPEAALNVDVAELRHWYTAPENPAFVAERGVDFAFTADGLEEPADFLPNLRRTVERGLAPDRALAALTSNPARFLGIQDTHGTVEAGKVANLVVTTGDLFQDGTVIRDVWVDGRRFPVEPAPLAQIPGEWDVSLSGAELASTQGRLTISGDVQRPSAQLTIGGQGVAVHSVSVQPQARRVRLDVDAGPLGGDGMARLSATVGTEDLRGWGELPDGSRLSWEGTRTGDGNGADTASGNGAGAPGGLDLPGIHPLLDYGRAEPPEQPQEVLVQGATVWTMGPEGILEDADLLVRNGQVVGVGSGLEASAGAQVIDAQGMHVTPGLIDAHIHSGSGGGINETGSAIVPEVRMGDVVTANNPWMYRQLAGGLTTAHLMHGSANPIGGQNVHMKMRWGLPAREQHLQGAPRTVKFALGENVKRRTERYPDTRMGTEQIIRDHFKAAREYEAAWTRWEETGEGIPPRRDLRMEALVDIMNGDILIQAHSYRQDEILMLMRVAEEFDVTIDAFHHGVEAYKVAPELREHGAAAVVWSDWSGFKIEAYDATLYNARLLHEAGVMTSLHSDNSTIAGRMNWEAGKMVRAGLDEEDALAMVTINTARALGIDDQVGSLEAGKDADFVIWNGNPLSQFSMAQQTWVDGRRYFDLDEHTELEARVAEERADLIQHLLNNR
jgi:imidazolonepropionase-like amidohydrolase